MSSHSPDRLMCPVMRATGVFTQPCQSHVTDRHDREIRYLSYTIHIPHLSPACRQRISSSPDPQKGGVPIFQPITITTVHLCEMLVWAAGSSAPWHCWRDNQQPIILLPRQPVHHYRNWQGMEYLQWISVLPPLVGGGGGSAPPQPPPLSYYIAGYNHWVKHVRGEYPHSEAPPATDAASH